MSEATQKFVDALAKGDNIEAGEMFKDALRDKVAASLDDRRKDLAQTIFSNNDENNGATNFSDPKPTVTDVSDRTDQVMDTDGNQVEFTPNGNTEPVPADEVENK